MERRELLAVAGFIGLLAAGLVAAGDSYVLSVLNFIGLFSIAVMGLVIILGYTGQIVLGHAAFMGVGAYTSAIVTVRWGWPPPAGIAAACVLVAAAAYLAGKPILRLRGFYLALATMALAVIVDSILVGWSEMTEGPSGMVGIPPFGVAGFRVVGEWPNFILISLLVAAALGVTLTIQRSMAGVGLRVIHRDEDLAATLGLDVASMKTSAFVLSALYAGIAGAFYAHYARFISPEIFGLHASFELLLVAMLGGVWTPYGAIVGAALLKFLPELLGVLQDFRLMAYGLIFIAITFYLPDGVAGWVRDVAARRRRAPGAPRVPGGISPRATAPGARDGAGQPALLAVQDLSRAFLGLHAVAGVGFRVPVGSITALIGPNGAGKSTIVNIISGLLPPDGGHVRFDGVNLVGRAPDAIARMGIARTFQNVRLLGDLTVLENVMAGSCARTRPSVWRTIAGVGHARAEYRAARDEARALMDELGLGKYEDRPARELPFGIQRVAEITRALLTRPRLLLLDEPAAGLNDAETTALAALLKRLTARGITILLIEHNMALVQAVADGIVVLHHGQKLVEGSPAAVLRDPLVIDAYLGRALAHAAR